MKVMAKTENKVLLLVNEDEINQIILSANRIDVNNVSEDDEFEVAPLMVKLSKIKDLGNKLQGTIDGLNNMMQDLTVLKDSI